MISGNSPIHLRYYCMSKPLTASDRATLVKLAGSLPKGSPEKRAILAGLKLGSKKVAGIKILVIKNGEKQGYTAAQIARMLDGQGRVLPRYREDENPAKWLFWAGSRHQEDGSPNPTARKFGGPWVGPDGWKKTGLLLQKILAWPKTVLLNFDPPPMGPKMVPTLRVLLEETASMSSGPHPLDPHAAIIAFSQVLEDYNIEEDAGDPESENYALATELTEDESQGQKMMELEQQSYEYLIDLFKGFDLDQEGHDQDGLVVKIRVRSWEDVKKVDEIISANHTGGDDEIDGGAPYFVARGFELLPNGAGFGSGGPRYGSGPGLTGEISDWLEQHKEA